MYAPEAGAAKMRGGGPNSSLELYQITCAQSDPGGVRAGGDRPARDARRTRVPAACPLPPPVEAAAGEPQGPQRAASGPQGPTASAASTSISRLHARTNHVAGQH